jgi:hypothetical protein
LISLSQTDGFQIPDFFLSVNLEAPAIQAQQVNLPPLLGCHF